MYANFQARKKKNLSRLAVSPRLPLPLPLLLSLSTRTRPSPNQSPKPVMATYLCESIQQARPPFFRTAAASPTCSRKFSSSSSFSIYLSTQNPCCNVSNASHYATLLLFSFFFTACNRNLQPTKNSPFHPFRFLEVKHLV